MNLAEQTPASEQSLDNPEVRRRVESILADAERVATGAPMMQPGEQLGADFRVVQFSAVVGNGDEKIDVYPGHGVGEVTTLEKDEFVAESRQFQSPLKGSIHRYDGMVGKINGGMPGSIARTVARQRDVDGLSVTQEIKVMQRAQAGTPLGRPSVSFCTIYDLPDNRQLRQVAFVSDPAYTFEDAPIVDESRVNTRGKIEAWGDEAFMLASQDLPGVRRMTLDDCARMLEQ